MGYSSNHLTLRSTEHHLGKTDLPETTSVSTLMFTQVTCKRSVKKGKNVGEEILRVGSHTCCVEGQNRAFQVLFKKQYGKLLHYGTSYIHSG